MLTPDERRWRRLLDDLHQDLQRLIELSEIRNEQKTAANRDAQRVTNEAEARHIAILAELQAQRKNPEANEAQAEHKSKDPNPWLSFVVQVLLCLFTALAFGAAAFYAYIANCQRIVMDQQLTTMNNTFLEVQKQTKAAMDSASAADAQVILSRQQVEGADAAILSIATSLDRSGLMSADFDNIGRVNATNIKAILKITFQEIPSSTRIGNEIRIPIHVPNLLPKPINAPNDSENVFHWRQLLSIPEDRLKMIFSTGQTAVVTDLIVTYNNGFRNVSDASCKAFMGFYFVINRTEVSSQETPYCTDLIPAMKRFANNVADAHARQRQEQQQHPK